MGCVVLAYFLGFDFLDYDIFLFNGLDGKEFIFKLHINQINVDGSTQSLGCTNLLIFSRYV